MTVKVPKKIMTGEAISRYEAPRGEDVHYVKSNGTEFPERVKIRAPTMANLAAIIHMINSGYLADVPIVIAAIDPCFSCTDRMILLKNYEKNDSLANWQNIRSYSIDWYKGKGIDFSRK